MGAVTTTAVVYNATTQSRINGLTALNFKGLVAASNQTGQPVTPLGNGEYELAFDDTQTYGVTCDINGYQPTPQSWGNNSVPVELPFAMQPIQGFSVQFQLTSGGPFVAPADIQVFVDVLGNVGLPLQSATISWGDNTTSSIDVSAVQNGGTSVSHNYRAAGSYTMTCSIVDSKNIKESAILQVEVAASASPNLSDSLLYFYKGEGFTWTPFNISQFPGVNGTKIAGPPFALPGGGTSIHVFAAGVDGSFLEFYFLYSWSIYNHSQDAGINGVKIADTPCALMDSGGSVHVFAAGVDGSFLEFYSAPGTGWAVYNHSQDTGINGVKIVGPPCALMDSGGSIHVFARGAADGSFLEFYKASGVTWSVYNHSQDAGINGVKIADTPGALMDSGGSIHVFAAGFDGSFLEFYSALGTGWEVYNHSQDTGINGVKIVDPPCALMDSGGSIHVFTRGAADGSFLEFYKASGVTWSVYNHSQDAGINGVKIADTPGALMDSGGSIHVFAAGFDGSFLEFYSAPGTDWAVYNHSQDVGMNDVKIAGSPSAFADQDGSIRVFAGED